VTFGSTGGAWSNYAIASELVFPIDADVPASSAASGFINPFTALGFIHEIKAKGHHGLIHTAAASALGRMVNKLCLK
jgi:NADPH:quinone reductase-like Zn-dependent oxidoreductase